METGGSVTRFIEGVAARDNAAVAALWERYFDQLVKIAERRLPARSARVADGEDVALSAFNSFCEGVAKGRFPQLHDRDNLWRLMVVITARKVVDEVERQTAKKRGGGKVHGESVLRNKHSPEDEGIEQIIGQEPTPEFAAAMEEQFQRMLDVLHDDKLRQIAVWKMEGWTNEEIAGRLGVVSKTIQRKLELIRQKWSKAAEVRGE